MTDILFILGAYLLGSVSSAIIVCKLMGLPDPRTQGSHNPGATNVLRIGGKKAAAITLLGDSLKGLIPVLIANLMGVEPIVLAGVAMAAFLGHLYPIFFGFKGGKGVATALGVQFGLGWQIGGTIALIWLFMAKVVNISSLSALVSMALAPLVVWYFWPAPELVGMQIILSLILFWRHRSNIRNLLTGAEGKIKDESGPEKEKAED
ncbi:glycerol-3-phosphate 1-O-acyltransferase PlsY [Solemya velesiana gill symbiont]|uniref:Glycerol-3-phosphate acyltransferase n=1 Tax=Solemya velesiana gill symbiont TaxID=1918948 RepID=A0A1T2KWN9_9GAMM|nr:glycerol-3-phosphate 1-O-acyltransferase PlsY [Solemya velesiana gill symbiont]OOZ37211.1 glycerol-3-phosphate acyltransferase [Solemya velesiana gill symbiont]